MPSDPRRRMLSALTDDRQRIGIPLIYIHALGDLTTAAVLQECVYWTGWAEKQHPDRDGWFYRTAEEWHDRLQISRHQVTQATKALAIAGVETKRGKIPSGGVATWYRVNPSMFEEWLVGEIARVSAQETVRTLQKGRSSTDSKIDLQSGGNSDLQKTSTSLHTEKTPEKTPDSAGAGAKNRAGQSPEDIRGHILFRAVIDALGTNPKDYDEGTVGKWKRVLKRAPENVTAEEIGACVRYILTDDWLSAPGRITPEIILGKLPQWRKEGRPSAMKSPNGKKPITQPGGRDDDYLAGIEGLGGVKVSRHRND